jgi:hypothetical protein
MRVTIISAMFVLSTALFACKKESKVPDPGTTKDAPPRARLSEAERVLAGLAESKNSCPTDFDYFPGGGMRIFWCHVESILPYRSLAEIAKMPVFLSGPHTKDKLELNSDTSFGNYNPVLVSWMVDNAVPEKIDPAIYDKFLRERARIYARAYRQLERNPDYLARERDYYMEYLKDPKGERPLDRHSKLAPEEWPNEYPPAVAFWLRRRIDGTSRLFFDGLIKLMKANDPSYLTALENTDLSISNDVSGLPSAGVPLKYPSNTLEGLVKNVFSQLGAFSPDAGCKDEFEYEPGGLRTQACRAFAIVDYKTLLSKLGMSIYLKGPHSTRLDLNNDRAFGHYNPAFVRWLSGAALAFGSEPAVMGFAQPMYNEYGRIPARAFYYAKRFLDDDRAKKKQMIDEYKKWMAEPGEDAHPRYGYWSMLPEMKVWEAQAIAGTGIAFWIRRAIDGTDQEFELGLKKLLRTYDGAWFARAEKTRIGDVSEALDVWFPAPPGYGEPQLDDGP